MVWRENIDSGYPNFQLDTRSSGSRRNLDYLLIRLNGSWACVAHAAARIQIFRRQHNTPFDARRLSVSFAPP